MAWIAHNPALRIKIRTEGALSALGHDRVFNQPVEVTVRTGDDVDGALVHVEGDLRKTTLLGSVSEADRAEILRRKDRDVLKTDVFPTVRFEGNYRRGEGVLAGTLTLHGTSQRVNLPVAVTETAHGLTAEGALLLDLRQFGIAPYKALLGALRVKSAVEVMYSLELEKGP